MYNEITPKVGHFALILQKIINSDSISTTSHDSYFFSSSAGITKRQPMVEGSRKVLWLPEGKCRTASMREDYVKELGRYDFNVLIQQICTKYVQTWMDANRHVQVDAYGPDDKDGTGRECSVKGWCGDDDACLLASQYFLHALYDSQNIPVENNA